MNNNGTIARLSQGGFTASCISCDFSDHQQSLTCQCLENGGQTRVHSTVALGMLWPLLCALNSLQG
jgi:hypothetical protein